MYSQQPFPVRPGFARPSLPVVLAGWLLAECQFPGDQGGLEAPEEGLLSWGRGVKLAGLDGVEESSKGVGGFPDGLL